MSICLRIVVALGLLLLAATARPGNSSAGDCSEAVYPESVSKSAESIYSTIFVYQSGPCVKMTFRRVGSEFDESEMNLADPRELPIPYTRTITAALLYPDRVDRVAMIGVGGGTILNYLSHYLPGADYVGVELDPKVLEFARNDFRLAANRRIRLVESDGRLFLLRNREQYDVIMLDAFRGGYIPSHLLTREFYELARKRLTPGGALAINVHDGNALFDSTLRTIGEVFPQVDTYWDGGSVIVVGSNRRIGREALLGNALRLQGEHGFRYPLEEILATRKEFVVPATAELLTDDFSPANQLAEINTINVVKRSK